VLRRLGDLVCGVVADATRGQTSIGGGGALGVALALVAGWIDRSLRRADAMAAASGAKAR